MILNFVCWGQILWYTKLAGHILFNLLRNLKYILICFTYLKREEGGNFVLVLKL